MTRQPVPDPRTHRRWQALASGQKKALIEASEWLYNPTSLARFDGSPDFPLHPDNRTGDQVMAELIRRAYVAGGYDAPEKPLETRQEDRSAPSGSDAAERFTHTDLLLRAARLEAELQRPGRGR